MTIKLPSSITVEDISNNLVQELFTEVFISLE